MILISLIIPRAIHGMHTLVLTETQCNRFDSAFSSLLKQVQGLRVCTATVAAHMLIGLIPISAEIEKRMLSLYGAICRMPKEASLKKLSRRQLQSKSLNSHSWFIKIFKVGLKYNIDIISALDMNWSKDAWRCMVKDVVFSHPKNAIKL